MAAYFPGVHFTVDCQSSFSVFCESSSFISCALNHSFFLCVSCVFQEVTFLKSFCLCSLRFTADVCYCFWAVPAIFFCVLRTHKHLRYRVGYISSFVSKLRRRLVLEPCVCDSVSILHFLLSCAPLRLALTTTLLSSLYIHVSLSKLSKLHF